MGGLQYCATAVTRGQGSARLNAFKKVGLELLGSSMAAVASRLSALLGEEKRVVTYKWLSRELSITSDAAKRALFSFCETSQSTPVEAIYLLSGWLSSEVSGGDIPCVWGLSLT